ncbi:MAG: hypothetical protein SOV34_03830, partial [Sodaliphilus sp.]|nr:hypothetical protein [Sodaliphilus sp.]
EGGGGNVWLVAWKLVSNDSKRTVAPPNAKHSTLPQGCFLCFLFLITFTIRQQYIIYLQQRNQRDGSFGMPLAYTNQKNRPFGFFGLLLNP